MEEGEFQISADFLRIFIQSGAAVRGASHLQSESFLLNLSELPHAHVSH